MEPIKIAVSSFFDWKQTVSATATIQHVDLTFSLVHYHNELQGGSKVNTLLGDASAVWRMKKLRLSAELRNIFNKENYVETTYSGISTLTDSYHLRPRELMITAQYSSNCTVALYKQKCSKPALAIIFFLTIISVPNNGMCVPNNGTDVLNNGMCIPNNGTELFIKQRIKRHTDRYKKAMPTLRNIQP